MVQSTEYLYIVRDNRILSGEPIMRGEVIQSCFQDAGSCILEELTLQFTRGK